MQIVGLSGGNEAQTGREAAWSRVEGRPAGARRTRCGGRRAATLASPVVLGRERGGRQREGGGEAGAQYDTLEHRRPPGEKPVEAISRPCSAHRAGELGVVLRVEGVETKVAVRHLTLRPDDVDGPRRM